MKPGVLNRIANENQLAQQLNPPKIAGMEFDFRVFDTWPKTSEMSLASNVGIVCMFCKSALVRLTL